MADQDDEMNQPATRRDVANLRGELEQTNATLRGMWRIFEEFRDENRAELRAMRAELAQHANAIKEHVTRELRGEIEVKASSTELRAVDDKYADLPARVTKLERAVFPPKRQRRR